MDGIESWKCSWPKAYITQLYSTCMCMHISPGFRISSPPPPGPSVHSVPSPLRCCVLAGCLQGPPVQCLWGHHQAVGHQGTLLEAGGHYIGSQFSLLYNIHLPVILASFPGSCVGGVPHTRAWERGYQSYSVPESFMLPASS